MLESLYVKNLALIERAEVEFGPGLNILSGETGAGKSILIGSVLAALGGKVSRDLIRRNESEAYVELIFRADEEAVQKKLAQMEFDAEDGRVILSRRITASKSVCRINGETVPASRVKELAQLLIDIHGQHEHQTLTKSARQLELVDRYGREEILPLREEVLALYRRHQELEAELEKRSVDEAVRLRTMDILRYEIEELDGAAVRPGEEKELSEEWKRLNNRDQVKALTEKLCAALSGENGGAEDILDEAVTDALALERADEGFAGVSEQLADARSLVSDALHMLKRGMDEDADYEERLADISERLDVLRRLMQKYGRDEEGLLSLLEEKQRELETYENLDEIRRRLQAKSERVRKKLLECCALLSEKRRAAADILQEKLKDAMVELNFLDVRFEIALSRTEEIHPGGFDEADFLIATNPGEELKPLAMVASGGELSRIMLAIKSVLAANEETGTLIFDEIDAGISGRTAQKVGGRLKEIAKDCQVICISHLPQIVSMADTHFVIEKDAVDQITTTHIRRLGEDESIRELARLLGGSEITDRVLENAEELWNAGRKRTG